MKAQLKTERCDISYIPGVNETYKVIEIDGLIFRLSDHQYNLHGYTDDDYNNDLDPTECDKSAIINKLQSIVDKINA